MTYSWVTLAIVLAVAGCAASADRIDVTSGGQRRSYLLAAPPPGAPKPPLLIALHGWLGTPEQMASMTGFSRAASARGMAVVYPAGEWRAWGIDPASHRGAEDAAFLAALVGDVAARTPIDTSRVYAAGFSNGGFMAQALACSGRVHLAGLAVVASALAASAWDACHSGPVPFLMIAGAADPVVPEAGLGAGKDRLLSRPETLAFWAGINGCHGFDSAAVASHEPGVAVARQTGRSCVARTQSYTVQGAGHGWPGGDSGYPAFIVGRATHAVDATAVILDFLLGKESKEAVLF